MDSTICLVSSARRKGREVGIGDSQFRVQFTPGEGSRGTLAILFEDAPSTRGFLLLEGSGDFRGYKASSCKISLRPFLLSIFPSFPNAPKPPHTRPSPSFRCKLAILAAPVGCAGPLITPPPPPPLSLRSRKLSHTPHSGDRLPQSIFKHPPCSRSPVVTFGNVPQKSLLSTVALEVRPDRERGSSGARAERRAGTRWGRR